MVLLFKTVLLFKSLVNLSRMTKPAIAWRASTSRQVIESRALWSDAGPLLLAQHLRLLDTVQVHRRYIPSVASSKQVDRRAPNLGEANVFNGKRACWLRDAQGRT